MAHYAKIENNAVTQVIVVNNNELLENGVENSAKGADFCQNLLGGEWIQTSYNNSFRKQFAGIGYSYDRSADVFVAPQPFPSWLLDNNHDWQPPTPRPEDGQRYAWDEATLTWIVVADKS